MKHPRVLFYAALTVVFALSAGATWPIAPLRFALVAAGMFTLVGTIANIIHAVRHEKYSLDSLREVHDRAELDEIDVPGGNDLDSVVCLCCGTAYSNRFPACPDCACRRKR